MLYFIFLVVLSKDCGPPATTGYAYSDTSGNTYGETSSLSCAVGYEGAASPSTVTCEATGAWTNPTGCTIKGTTKLILLDRGMYENVRKLTSRKKYSSVFPYL